MATKNALVQKQDNEAPMKFSQFIGDKKIQSGLAASLGSEKSMTKLVSNLSTVVSMNPELQKCDFATITSAGLLANSLDLPLTPSLGYAYVVPFDDKKNKRKVATFVMGYKGYLQLAIRSGYYRNIVVLEIKEGELLGFNPLTEEIKLSLIEDEFEREAKPTIGYYAMFELVQGFKKAMYWSKDKMLIHADRYSPAFSLKAKGKKKSFADYEAGKVPADDLWMYSSFWYKEFDSMAKKTMLRRLLSTWGIMSTEMQIAFESEINVERQEADSIEFFNASNAETDFFEDEEATEIEIKE